MAQTPAPSVPPYSDRFAETPSGRHTLLRCNRVWRPAPPDATHWCSARRRELFGCTQISRASAQAASRPRRQPQAKGNTVMRVMHFGPASQANRRERVQRRRANWLACLAALAAALLGCVLPQVASAESELSPGLGASTELGASAELEISLTPSAAKPYTLCPPGGRMIECNIVVDPPTVATPSGYRLPDGGPLLEGGGEGGGLNPENLQSAYKIPTTGGSGETVALVDAYGYKSAESDLAKYREKNKLAACTKASRCFKQVNEKGEEKNYPAEGGGLEAEWSLETSLDMDMVSAACPNCKILLVEARHTGPRRYSGVG